MTLGFHLIDKEYVVFIDDPTRDAVHHEFNIPTKKIGEVYQLSDKRWYGVFTDQALIQKSIVKAKRSGFRFARLSEVKRRMQKAVD